MIVKIWPIKASKTSSYNGLVGLKNAVNYVCDPQKVMVRDKDLHTINLDLDDYFGPENISRSISYMQSRDKTEAKYISGYRCNVSKVVEDFETQKLRSLKIRRDQKKIEHENVAFHIVQSFPPGLDISDEEVHQCGIELCRKIGKHQALICSHVHAVEDKNGKIRGACKHNHILINAYIHSNDLDPKHPNRVKYNDCLTTYAQLRVWNDEIAIEHGLPIIRNPDNERSYSWFESEAIRNGISWKEQVRNDIVDVRKASSNWEEFLTKMSEKGYKIRDGVHVSYQAPDRTHRVRGGTLGREYTKEGLELYWNMRKYSKAALENAVQENQMSPLTKRTMTSNVELSVGVPIGGLGSENKIYYYLPIVDNIIPEESLQSYFVQDEIYDVFDEERKLVTVATGEEILCCIKELNQSKEARQAEEKRQQAKERDQFVYSSYINTKTMRPYRTSLYDENGRRRSMLELLFILVVTILECEGELWTSDFVPQEHQNNVFYAPINRKIQDMIDSIALAQEEGIETPSQLDERLKKAGALVSRTKSALKRTEKAKEKMKKLNSAVVVFREFENLVSSIEAMGEGNQKEELKYCYSKEINQFNEAMATMQGFEVVKPKEISDFEKRYKKINDDLDELHRRMENANKEYSKLKKLKYHNDLANMEPYCYGPEFTPERQKTIYESFRPKERPSLDEIIRGAASRAPAAERVADRRTPSVVRDSQREI